MKYELEMSYTFAQIVLFRPLLHYLQIVADGGTISLMQSHRDGHYRLSSFLVFCSVR
jgi:hypothetical protein